MPPSRDGRSSWLRQLARDEEITLHLVRLLGAAVIGLDCPFPCLLHQDCQVTLTRGRNGEIVYKDPSLASARREFQTIPELLSALLTGSPKRLRPLQHVLWRLWLLHHAGLVVLPPATVPGVASASPDVRAARDGFELLIRCRSFLDPGKSVSYTRAFVEAWCGIAEEQSRQAIYELIRQHVIEKVDEAPSGYRNKTSLYQPGRGGPR